MSDLIRVFYHELGHFIANELNAKYYNGTGTKSITIERARTFEEKYIGDTKVNLSADEREKKTPEKPLIPGYLASSSYGCFFECYYTRETLNHCFNHHGGDDYAQWYGCLKSIGIEKYRVELADAEKAYFESLIKTVALTEIMHLQPERYLIRVGTSHYGVDVAALKEHTTSFVDQHYPMYRQLIETYQQLIDHYSTNDDPDPKD